jgi:type VI protein secretion system component Hcp
MTIGPCTFVSGLLRFGLAASALAVILASPGRAQIYLKISGVDGESKDPTHQRWIEAASVQSSPSAPGANPVMTASAGGKANAIATPPPPKANATPPGPQAVKSSAGSNQGAKAPAEHEIVSPRDPQSGLPTGKRMHQAITIIKQIDKATPLLKQAEATQRRFPEVLIEVYRSGALAQRYLLTEVLVSSIQAFPAVKAGNVKTNETVTLVATGVSQDK